MNIHLSSTAPLHVHADLADKHGSRDQEARTLTVAVGRKVRRLRGRLRMTRRDLSHATRISERYLSEVEKGRANPTLGLLMRIARTLGEPLSALVPADAHDSAISPPLAQLLARMDGERQAELYRSLLRQNGQGGEQRRGVALIGLRGAGKSTLGKMLAEAENVPFVRLTDVIQDLAGMPVAELVELMGPGAYRRMERRALETVIERHRIAVVEAGGGLVMDQETFGRLMQAYQTVWVSAAPQAHMQRVAGQDLKVVETNSQAMDELRSILREREPFYAQADHSLDTTGRTPAKALAELRRMTEGALSGRA